MRPARGKAWSMEACTKFNLLMATQAIMLLDAIGKAFVIIARRQDDDVNRVAFHSNSSPVQGGAKVLPCRAVLNPCGAKPWRGCRAVSNLYGRHLADPFLAVPA